MLKWIITDKVDKLLHKSDLVQIDNHKFYFYAERNKREYSGLKIFTSVVINKANLPVNNTISNARRFIQKNTANKARLESPALKELQNTTNIYGSGTITTKIGSQLCKSEASMLQNLMIYSQIR